MIRRALGLALLAPLTVLSGCENPSCVFAAGNCQDIPSTGGGGDGPGGGGGIFGSAGEVTPYPVVGNWIDPTPPTYITLLPDGSSIESTGTVWARFSESIDPTSTEGAFEMIDLFFGIPVPLLNPAPLVGDGTIAVIQPLIPLQQGTSYLVRLAEGHTLRDLTGQPLVEPAGALGSFNVGFDGAEPPAIVGIYPKDGAINEGDLSEVTILFDRQMDVTTFSEASWRVTIDDVSLGAGFPPKVLVPGGMIPAPIASVYTWSFTGADGYRQSLGQAIELEVNLSPAGNKILDPAGEALPSESFSFRTATFGAPTSVTKLTTPTSAFGAAELSGVTPVLDVALPAGVEAIDDIVLYGFGLRPGTSDEVFAQTQSRSLVAGQALATYSSTDLDLISGATPNFLDGELSFAAAIHRNSLRSQLRVIDGDASVLGDQRLVLDTVPPVLLGLGDDGTQSATFRNDLTDLSVVGLASERIGFARVSIDGGGPANFVGTELPPVVMADRGLFVARPVALGTVDPLIPANFTVEVFDRAGNAAIAPMGSQNIQLGGVGFWDPMPLDLRVEVYDASTLQPVIGALVMIQQDDGGHTFLGSGTTDSAGMFGFSSVFGATPIITVDAAGYDLFTVQVGGLRVAGIPLQRSNEVAGFVQGSTSSTLPIDIGAFERTIGDGRSTPGAELLGTAACGLLPNSTLVNCPFGPYPIRPGRRGAQTLAITNLAGLEATLLIPNLAEVFASSFLQAFTLRAPAPAVLSGDTDAGVTLDVANLLFLAGVEEAPVSTEPIIFTAGALTNFATPLGQPEVSIEAISPGSPDAWIVGAGASLDDPMNDDTWFVRAAWPGVADDQPDGPMGEMGTLMESGTLETDPFLRVNIQDDMGGLAIARAPLSVVALVPVLAPLDLPVVTAPAPAAVVGPSFDATLEDVIPSDVFGIPTQGLYLLTLIDPAGRRWTLWAANPAGVGGSVDVHVPDVTAMGGTPLTAGTTVATGTLFADPNLDPTEFQWSEVPRRAWARSQSAPLIFTFTP
jgi:hypothetical protein